MSLLIWMAAAGATALSAPTDDKVITFAPSFFEAAAAPTAYEMVVRLPGFSINRGTDARGLADAGGNVLIDGRPPISKNDLLVDILKRIPATAVERIELIRGGALGIDMRGKSVLANVVRKSAGGVRGAASIETYWASDGELLPGAQAETRWNLGDLALEFSLLAGRKPDDKLTAGWRTQTAPDGTVLSRSDREAFGETRRAWTTGALEAPLGVGRLKLNAAFKRSPYESRALETRSPGDVTEIETIDEDPWQFEVGARYTRPLGANAELEAVGFRQWSGARTDALNVSGGDTRKFRLDRDTDETIWRGQISWDSPRRVRVELGAEAALNTLISQTGFYQNGIAMPIPAANVRVRERRNEVFATSTTRPTGSLTLEARLRQEWSAISAHGDATIDKTLAFTKPRLAATWNFAGSHQLRLRLAREVEQLSFDDFVASSALINTGVVLAGNPDLEPQQAWVAEVALESRFWSHGAAVLELRHSRLADVIDRVPIRDVHGAVIADAPGNIGEGELDELTVRLTFPLDRFGFAGAEFTSNATFRHSRVTDPTTGLEREISRSFPHEIEFRLRQDVPGTRVTWGVQAFTPMTEHSYRYSEIEMRRLGTWITPFVEYAPSRGWLIRAEVQSATKGDLERTRYLYGGSRATNAFSYSDRRATTWGRAFHVNLRKTFGD
jgi:hypothetical protein